MNKKVVLMILDGWGIATNPKVSAIDAAKTPFIDSLYQKYPHSKLEASGLAVGLPEGQMGNSEVGHMNLGAGRVVYQNLVRINKAVTENTLGQEPELAKAFDYAKANNKSVHFIGLVSDGGVHAHIEHLKSLLSSSQEAGLSNVFVHAFTDGRDCDPKSGLKFLTDLQNHCQKTGAKIASVTGRYYSMDRDNRWERVALAYNAMVKAEGTPSQDVLKSIEASYAENVTDEFIKPIIMTDAAGAPVAKIEEGDVVICFNFRTDRGREITQALTQKDFHEQNMYKMNLYYLTMTEYDKEFQGVRVIFNDSNLPMTMGEVLEGAGKKQIRIAETEKYPHVTFFFSGGREQPFEGQTNILRNSPKVATYDLQPEMSAGELRDALIPELEKEEVDFVCLNFANPDMVGHTGVFSAVVKAVETVDACAQAVVETGLQHGYSFIIIADHGNADVMINEDGSPNTAHSTNLVPCILVDKDFHPTMKNGKLGDVSPTILKMMGVAQPKEMTGETLF
ncbi:2,3-bisphosphoglycerate-independent phosphoglycerate mutase [Sandaracinomonas limnophila]|uniref:2,3-bisphosphoglycerate-independent phosphoglycerate mutase n=1 Tax=Sandaracinomonas limnophila TaxID=1862386 RepID=A0A437PUJ6_9BACT|nr:2,3-bisphosphoglycerate-independent phosphoglycerate mutase [Sandaracinomonas limnophila]RVU25941.1 2,3-bisphosphoglycerate-independent phosphoglycerate mutase [Sandaracinomonas limnophila]